MQKITVENVASIEAKRVWSLLTDINNYPKYIKFVVRIKDPPSDFKEGVFWTDITDIFWIPSSIRHKIIKIEKNKRFVYEVFLPFGGKMMEECRLITEGKETRIITKIEFSFKNYLLDFVFGAILKKRLRKMMGETARNLKAHHS